MDINDYLISQEGLKLPEIITDWHWMLPDSFEIWIVNRFGDLILALDDGKISLLDTGAGRLDPLADSKDHFADLADDPKRFAKWFLVDAVDEMIAAGHTLEHRQCYSYLAPPGLGGAYAIENYMVTDLHVHLSIHGQIFEQTKAIPDGTKIKFKVT